MIRMCAVGVVALAGVACAGDDDDDAPAPAPAAADDGGAADDGDPGSDDDIIGTILRTVFGLPPGLLDGDERDCMNEQLAPVFPEGAPADVQLTEDLADRIDDVAEACSVELGL